GPGWAIPPPIWKRPAPAHQLLITAPPLAAPPRERTRLHPNPAASRSDMPGTAAGIACGAGAALFWAAGFVAARHGIAAGFSPADIVFHRFVWAGLVFLPFVARAGLRDLGGLVWGQRVGLS